MGDSDEGEGRAAVAEVMPERGDDTLRAIVKPSSDCERVNDGCIARSCTGRSGGRWKLNERASREGDADDCLLLCSGKSGAAAREEEARA